MKKTEDIFLEFANAQLLELRYYDHVVDKELDGIHANISRKESLSIWRIKQYERYAAEVRRTIAELMDITDKIDTSLKVTEDVYYAKIYLSALRLFRVKEVEGSIKKKLEIASNIYDMFYREISTKRRAPRTRHCDPHHPRDHPLSQVGPAPRS